MKKKKQIYTNVLFRRITGIYSAILLVIGSMASYMAYSKEQIAILSQMEQNMVNLKYAYEANTEDFWRLFMPVYQDRGKSDGIYAALERYFETEDKASLSQMDRKELLEAMQTIMAYNHGVSWIGVYAGKDNINYLMFQGDEVLTQMPLTFPFIEDLEQKKATKEVYGSKLVSKNGEAVRTFAVCGGSKVDFRGGKIIFGYDTAKIHSVYKQGANQEDVRFFITNEHGVVFDSSGLYDDTGMQIAQSDASIYHHNGEWWCLYRLARTGDDYSIFCIVPWWNMFFSSHAYTLYIFTVVILFWICSVVIYRWFGNVIIRKIDRIQQGLHEIGENHLDYRIDVPDLPTDEFESIGQSINKMTVRLQKNINKTYELRLKQKEAVLAELQARFDPHFLYNTLEVIRGRVYENGDLETSDIIINLAQIFRSFIGSDRFVSIREEIDLCDMYLSLLKYRYEDRITIQYEIESAIMQYGIIRNLLQPVLENFFVHGFKSESQHNILKITGKVCEEKYIWFCIWDNGLGIPKEKLEKIKKGLNDAAVSAQNSYGLKNIHRRIKLFYGPECGMEIKSNEAGGTTVEVKISRLTCREHEERLVDFDGFEE